MSAETRPPQRASPPRLHLFDGLRGVLAVYVMLGHLTPMLPLPAPWAHLLGLLFGHGFAAVNLFFALSGLVIVQSLARFEGRIAAFWRARARRLLPVYYLVLSVAILGLALPTPFSVMPWLHPGDVAHQIWELSLPAKLGTHILVHLFLAQGMLLRHSLTDAQFSLLGPSWSLSTEWQFYALIAVLSLKFRPTGTGLAPLVWIFLALALAGRAYAALAPFDWQFHRAFLPNEAGYFALGIAAAGFWRGGHALKLFLATLLITTLLGASHGADAPTMLAKALPPLIWAMVVNAQRTPDHRFYQPVAALLSHKAVQWLGAISYPLYLLNEPVSRALALIIATATGQNRLWFTLLWLPLSLGLSISLAALLHYQVERRFTRTRQPPARMAASAS